MANIQPLGSLVLVKKIEETDKTTKSGLVIAASVVDSGLDRGTVIEVGPGDHDNQGNLHPIPLKVGDTIIYSGNHATEVEDDDREKYYFINWRNLLGVVKENN